MQTIVFEIAFTFMDDAVALVRGFARILRNMTIATYTASRARILAPVERLARACDVGGVIAARHAATTRTRTRGADRPRTAAARRWRDRLNIFRGLYELT